MFFSLLSKDNEEHYSLWQRARGLSYPLWQRTRGLLLVALLKKKKELSS